MAIAARAGAEEAVRALKALRVFVAVLFVVAVAALAGFVFAAVTSVDFGGGGATRGMTSGPALKGG